MSFSSDPALLANQLPISVEFPPEWDKFLPILSLLYKRIANAVNSKEGGLYNLVETATFIQYFSSSPNIFRPVYRTTVDFGALPNATSASVAHGISFSSSFRMTRIYAAATDPVSLLYIPIPYASSTLADNIEISVDSTNITITTAVDYSSYTACTVVLEYTKIA